MPLTDKQRQQTADRQRRFRERQATARAQELQQKGMPALPPIPTMPGTARWKALTEQARATLETCRDEMQSYFEERSESWQESEKGSELQERIDQLCSILDDLA